MPAGSSNFLDELPLGGAPSKENETPGPTGSPGPPGPPGPALPPAEEAETLADLSKEADLLAAAVEKPRVERTKADKLAAKKNKKEAADKNAGRRNTVVPEKVSGPPPEAPEAKEPPPVDAPSHPVQMPGRKSQEATDPVAGDIEKADIVEPTVLVTLGSSTLDEEMVNRWDEMLGAVDNATRNAVWETGVSDMQSLLRTAKADLLRPRGPFGQPELKSLEAWLATSGYKLPTESQVSPRGFRPPGNAIDTKTGEEVDNRAAREARIAAMKKMQTGG